MDPIALDPGAYKGTYKLIGGESSLDLINTVSWPGTIRGHDWLDRSENVTAWAVAAGVIGEDTRRALDSRPAGSDDERDDEPDDEIAEVRRIRDVLRRALLPLATGERPTVPAVVTLDTLVRRSSMSRRIDSMSLRWMWVEPASLPELLAPVIWNAAHVLTGVDHTRIGRCRSCGWVFRDGTRNRSRRWCDMADCGSRHKSNRYYQRTRST